MRVTTPLRLKRYAEHIIGLSRKEETLGITTEQYVKFVSMLSVIS